jgi:hypothetical protein
MHEMEALLNGPPFVPYEGDNDPMRLWSPFYADKLGKVTKNAQHFFFLCWLTLIQLLVAIAKHYGFDGWLFNIECEFFPFPTNSKTKAEELAKYVNPIFTHE